MKKHPQHAASIQFKLGDVQDPALREKLEMKYMQFEVVRREQVVALRQAQKAMAEAQKNAAEVAISELDFIIEAGEAFDLIQTEPYWVTRRNKEGQVLLECLLTQNDIQNITRKQVKNMREQTSTDDGDDSPGMFGDD